MNALIAIALKSLLVAGVALLMLRVAKNRSAAERSWVAHIGLLALVVLPLAPLVIPALAVEAPAFVGEAPASAAQTPVVARQPVSPSVSPVAIDQTAEPGPVRAALSSVDLASILYWIPTAILLGITMMALARLLALRARAEVLCDPNWLSALARAQKRMGFKHGTALLTSDDLPSPISWGLMRPVILLNTRAVDAASEAEAIIAHELAHVARLDWIKLLLARVATALFWFNPFVWMLAREAHQLREEAADDSVLAANIADTDYAQLLVGIARHECRGLLLGAHGVAPSKSSLARRVARVLDAGSARGPVARSFALGVFVGAMGLAAPLAALTLTPKGGNPDALTASSEGTRYYPAGGVPLPTPVRDSVNRAVTSAVSSAMSAVQPIWSDEQQRDAENEEGRSDGNYYSKLPSGATIEVRGGMTIMRNPSGATITVYPADGKGRQKVVMRAASGAIQTFDDARNVPGLQGLDLSGKHKGRKDSAIAQAIGMKLGVTPEYVAEMRAAAPNLRDADTDELIGMRAIGVTGAYVRDLASVGLRGLDADELTGARAIGLTAAYVRSLNAAGIHASLDDYIAMRAVGVGPSDVAFARRREGRRVDADDVIGLKTAGAIERPEQPERPEKREKREPPEPPEPPEVDHS
ncbi:MAG: M56 family metallopeptidase [Sphingomicrobium sp.]